MVLLGENRQLLNLAEHGELVALLKAVGGAVVEEADDVNVRVDVVAQAPRQFDALLVHAGQHRAFGLALKFTDRRRRQTQQKMRSDLTHRRYPRPGKQNVAFKISEIPAHKPEEKKQPGNRN